MDFPKPKPKVPLALPSKSGLIAQLEQREVSLQLKSDELTQLEQRVREKHEMQEARDHELEAKARALEEGDLLLKNQRMQHQRELAQLMEQKELGAFRTELTAREERILKKEEFLAQMETRLNEQFSVRERDLSKREAWVSAEHVKATANNARRLQAIVFTDVVSYSALMQANESLTIKKVRADLQRMKEEGQTQGGMLINTMGDGLLMIFPSAIQAVRFSLAMQKAFSRNNDPGALRHRFGIHIADVALLQDGGIAGDGVNSASRLESMAPNGGICLSQIVYFIVKGKLPLPPSSMEMIALKNISEPVAVYKYAPESILAMSDNAVFTPAPVLLEEEERSAPPFAPGATAGTAPQP
jgi:class 3 adenylate cyclase